MLNKSKLYFVGEEHTPPVVLESCSKLECSIRKFDYKIYDTTLREDLVWNPIKIIVKDNPDLLLNWFNTTIKDTVARQGDISNRKTIGVRYVAENKREVTVILSDAFITGYKTDFQAIEFEINYSLAKIQIPFIGIYTQGLTCFSQLKTCNLLDVIGNNENLKISFETGIESNDFIHQKLQESTPNEFEFIILNAKTNKEEIYDITSEIINTVELESETVYELKILKKTKKQCPTFTNNQCKCKLNMTNCNCQAEEYSTPQLIQMNQ